MIVLAEVVRQTSRGLSSQNGGQNRNRTWIAYISRAISDESHLFGRIIFILLSLNTSAPKT